MPFQSSFQFLHSCQILSRYGLPETNIFILDDLGLPSLDEASMSVDALVAESVSEASLTPLMSYFENHSRSSTPSLPPGLNIPNPQSPAPGMREDPIAKPLSRIVPTSAPFTPSRNVSTAYIPRVATPLSSVSVPHTPVQSVAIPLGPESSALAKQDVKTLASNSGLSKTIAIQAAQGAPPSVLQAEDFPMLEKGKGKEVPTTPSGPRSMTLSKKSIVTPTVSPAGVKTAGKKQTPGVILNIAVPAQLSSTETASGPNTPVKTAASTSAFPPLPSTNTTSISAQNPPNRPAPKTLRLVPTPKTESPPVDVTMPIQVLGGSAVKVLSRQPSIASMTRLERPSTPVSEIISDNASMTSASLSRPSSPPPNRVGSAPVRSTTKSQQKKQRKEAQKEKEKSEIDTVIESPAPEVEIAPIMGRKKKQKKEKVVPAGRSTPTVSRPPSPKPSVVEVEKVKPEPKVEETPPVQTTAPAPPLEIVTKALDSKGKGPVKNEELTPTEPPAPTVENVDESADRPVPTPSLVLQELVTSGLLPDPNKLSVFKAPTGFNQRLEYGGDLQDIDLKLVITEEDRVALQAGKPVHKIAHGLNRIMLTPNGDCVRNLTAAEEERYLELQSRILEDSGPAAFVSARHNASNGFTLIGGRAVPNGPPAFFPPAEGNVVTTPLDPVSKIQRDEALSYINQYVLPSLSTNSQLERALNANAINAEMLRPIDIQPWGNWAAGLGHGVDDPGSQSDHDASIETPYGAHSNDGILATGLESMTAHFAVGRENNRGQPMGSVTLLSLTDSESAMQSAKKETEKLEKSLNQLLKKNRRLLLGAGH